MIPSIRSIAGVAIALLALAAVLWCVFAAQRPSGTVPSARSVAERAPAAPAPPQRTRRDEVREDVTQGSDRPRPAQDHWRPRIESAAGFRLPAVEIAGEDGSWSSVPLIQGVADLAAQSLPLTLRAPGHAMAVVAQPEPTIRLAADAWLALDGAGEYLARLETELSTRLTDRLGELAETLCLLERFADGTLNLAVCAEEFVHEFGLLRVSIELPDHTTYELAWIGIRRSSACRARLPDPPETDGRPLLIRVKDRAGRVVDRFEVQVEVSGHAVRERITDSHGMRTGDLTARFATVSATVSGRGGAVLVDSPPHGARVRLHATDPATRQWAAVSLTYRGDPVDLVLDRGVLRATGRIRVEAGSPLPESIALRLRWKQDVEGRYLERPATDLHVYPGVAVAADGTFAVDLPERTAAHVDRAPAIEVEVAAVGAIPVRSEREGLRLGDPVDLGTFPLERNPPVVRIAPGSGLDAESLAGVGLRPGGMDEDVDWAISVAAALDDGSIALYLRPRPPEPSGRAHMVWKNGGHTQTWQTFPGPPPDLLWLHARKGATVGWLAREGLETWRVMSARPVQLLVTAPAGRAAAEVALRVDWRGAGFALGRVSPRGGESTTVDLMLPEGPLRIEWEREDESARGALEVLSGSRKAEIRLP